VAFVWIQSSHQKGGVLNGDLGIACGKEAGAMAEFIYRAGKATIRAAREFGPVQPGLISSLGTGKGSAPRCSRRGSFWPRARVLRRSCEAPLDGRGTWYLATAPTWKATFADACGVAGVETEAQRSDRALRKQGLCSRMQQIYQQN
jgi:hypothetical protein